MDDDVGEAVGVAREEHDRQEHLHPQHTMSILVTPVGLSGYHIDAVNGIDADNDREVVGVPREERNRQEHLHSRSQHTVSNLVTSIDDINANIMGPILVTNLDGTNIDDTNIDDTNDNIMPPQDSPGARVNRH